MDQLYRVLELSIHLTFFKNIIWNFQSNNHFLLTNSNNTCPILYFSLYWTNLDSLFSGTFALWQHLRFHPLLRHLTIKSISFRLLSSWCTFCFRTLLKAIIGVRFHFFLHVCTMGGEICSHQQVCVLTSKENSIM